MAPQDIALADGRRHVGGQGQPNSQRHTSGQHPSHPPAKPPNEYPSNQAANKTPPASKARGAASQWLKSYTQEQMRVISPAKARSPLSQGATK